jgi:hypothetical protein
MSNAGAWVAAMRAGRFADAWAIEHATIAARDPATRDDAALPYHLRWVWDGTPLDGREVLVRSYHGLGDAIQFARYLPLLAARAARVTLEVQPRLIPLLSQIEGVAAFIPFDEAKPSKARDVDIELGELPGALRVPPDAIAGAYLAWQPADVAPGATGLCYAAGDWDPARSIPPAMLLPLCEERCCTTLVAEPTLLPVTNPAGCPFSIEETAALVAAADAVVTVDTMVAHLAGALGRPTWLLLQSAPDWRWTPDARRSAWYASMRVFTQPSPGDWSSVIAEVATDLARERGVPVSCHA